MRISRSHNPQSHIWGIVLLTLLCFAFVGCGKGEDKSESVEGVLKAAQDDAAKSGEKAKETDAASDGEVGSVRDRGK